MRTYADQSAKPRNARCGKNLYRLSLDGSGSDSTDLGEVAERLGPFGVHVVDTGCSARSSFAASEILIDLTRPIDLPLIEHVLRPTGRKILGLCKI